MKTLIIDTSMTHLQVGLFDADQCVSLFSQEQKHRLGDVLHQTIQECFNDAKWSLNVLDRIIVTKGPGSFTGVRVGLAATRALALALSVPILGISSLEAMALSVKEPVLCAIDTRRKDFFTQQFDAHSHPQSDIKILNQEQLDQQTGIIIIDQPIDLSDVNCFFLNCEINSYQKPKPLYVRGADAALPKNLPELNW